MTSIHVNASKVDSDTTRGKQVFRGKHCGMRFGKCLRVLLFSCRVRSIASISRSEMSWHLQDGALPVGQRHALIEMLQSHIQSQTVCEADRVRQSSEADCAASVCGVDCVASVRRGRLCCVSQARQTVLRQSGEADCASATHYCALQRVRPLFGVKQPSICRFSTAQQTGQMCSHRSMSWLLAHCLDPPPSPLMSGVDPLRVFQPLFPSYSAHLSSTCLAQFRQD